MILSHASACCSMERFQENQESVFAWSDWTTISGARHLISPSSYLQFVHLNQESSVCFTCWTQFVPILALHESYLFVSFRFFLFGKCRVFSSMRKFQLICFNHECHIRKYIKKCIIKYVHSVIKKNWTIEPHSPTT